MARDETIKLSLIDGVTRTLSQIQQGVSGVGASLTKLNQGAELAAKGFGLIGAAASSIGNAVQGAADIETALSRVADITRATADEQVALQKAVGDAVSTLGVSANDAANALLLMSEDGFSAADAIGSLNTVLAFAKANAQDAATATNALGGVLDTFGEKPAIIAQLADQLTAASRAAGVGTSTLQQGLAAIGVQAEQAGLGVSDAVAALAALASRGIEGTQAAKQLGTILTELNNPASKAGKALDEAGLAGKSFAEIVDVLSNDSAKAAPVLEALGNRPRAALKVLLAEGGGALREFGQIVDDAAGSSERAADVVDETFNGAIARLQNSVANLRNEFLSPILQPLAEEAAALAEKINALGDSPQFARIRDQFQELATNAIQAVGDLIEKADLEAWAGNVADFASDAKTTFDGLVVVVKTTAGAIRGIGAAIDYVAERGAAFDAALGLSRESAKKFGAAATDLDRPLSHLNRMLGDGKKTASGQAQAMDDASGATRAFVSPAEDAADAAQKIADGLGEVPKAAKLTEVTLEKLAGGAEQAAIGLERLRLATLTSAIAALARENLQGTDTFRALVAEVAKTEASIAKMQEAIDKAKGAQKDLADQTDSAANSLRNFSASADSAGAAAENASGSNSQVAKSFGNIGKQAAAASADLGNMSQQLIDLALAMQAQATSGQQIIDIWAGITRQYEESNKRIQQAIDLAERQNAATSEEARIRRQLEAQYGTDSTLLEKLVQLRLQENREREKSIELADREAAAIERANAARNGQIGGFGAQQAAAATPASTGGRGTAGGEGSRAPAQIIVQVQGMTTDQARAFVEQSVVPELERINRLSR